MRPAGPIRLLTHLRYFGLRVQSGELLLLLRRGRPQPAGIVAEITNTPWKERHAYVLPVDAAERHGRALHWRFAKQFHVSPFMPMQRRYAWRFTAPGEQTCTCTWT